MPNQPAFEFCLRSEGGFLLTGPGCGGNIICTDALDAYDYWHRYLAPSEATLVVGSWRGVFRGPARARAR